MPLKNLDITIIVLRYIEYSADFMRSDHVVLRSMKAFFPFLQEALRHDGVQFVGNSTHINWMFNFFTAIDRLHKYLSQSRFLYLYAAAQIKRSFDTSLFCALKNEVAQFVNNVEKGRSLSSPMRLLHCSSILHSYQETLYPYWRAQQLLHSGNPTVLELSQFGVDNQPLFTCRFRKINNTISLDVERLAEQPSLKPIVLPYYPILMHPVTIEAEQEDLLVKITDLQFVSTSDGMSFVPYSTGYSFS